MTDKQIRDLIFNVVLAAAIQGISAAIPFLKLPVISTVFSFIVTKVAEAIYVELSRYVVFSLIDMRVGEERDKYKAAVVELKETTSKPGATPEEINAAKQEFERRLRALISLKP